MGRYVNWILIAVGVAAAAVLTAEGVLDRDFLDLELSELLCIVSAVPPVIAAIRMENTRRIEANRTLVTSEIERLGDRIAGEMNALGDRLQAALSETSQAHAEEMKTAVVEHGDRLGKHQLEAVTGTLLRMVASSQMEQADRQAEILRWSGTDTGPFRIPK